MDDEPISTPEVHASDLPARHAPKDSNPDRLGWNQSCYRYTRDTQLKFSGSRETRTHKSRWRPPVFKTGSSSGRMASVGAAGVGIEPTASWFRARRHYQQQLPRSVRQTKTASANRGSQLQALRPGIAPDLRASKAHAATTRRRECPAGIEPASPAWKAGASADRPRAHVVKRKGRESNPRRRITGAVSLPLDDQCLVFSGTRGTRTLTRPVKSRGCCR